MISQKTSEEISDAHGFKSVRTFLGYVKDMKIDLRPRCLLDQEDQITLYRQHKYPRKTRR